ncbi:PD40 domain-containing protein [Nocardioides sp. J2M5]|uniref:PD40 domain-containing protein n=1 Tax=Nocardioides palaemonis TaxID=2829810 RepID=UPI001BA6C917|nr:PD40 domain-containing protein [Nocardioides palaemonis]MBS2939886.1 PD40 domain-containing protein [Nocardioides palaemonis]
MTDLRTSLHRLADSTEPLPVDDDLWGRAQAARRRGQALAVAAVIVLVVTVGGLASVWPTADRESRTAAQEVPGGAIPRVIADVPDDLEPTEDYVIGRASVAFVSAGGDPVVVSAVDGVAHALDLPSYGPASSTPVLSPDGRRLAYGMDVDGPTQVEVVDLETGRWWVRPVGVEDRVRIDAMSWSPGSNWLGWVAPATRRAPAVAGTLRADSTEAWRSVLEGNATSIAVADGGDAVVGTDSGLTVLPLRGEAQPLRTGGPVRAAAFSPDGARVALVTGADTASYTFDLPSDRLVAHPFPEGTLEESITRPLGWIDDRIQLLLVQPVDSSGAELVVTTPKVDDRSTWRRRVGSVETSGVANSLSVAVDLVPELDGTSSQELTHDFGDTTAPGRDVSWMIGLGVAAAIAVLMALRWLWRRLRNSM